MERTLDPALAPSPATGGWMARLERASVQLNKMLEWAAGIALLGMLLFTVVDVALRTLGRPLAGSYEVIGWLSAASMALVLGSVQQHRGHVTVDLVEARLGPRLRALVGLANSLLAMLLFGVVAGYVARYGYVLQQTGSLSETLRVVVYPWVYVVAAGGLGLTFALLIDVLRGIARVATLACTPS